MIITAARHSAAQAATRLPQLAGRCCNPPSGCDLVACLTQEPQEPLGRLESLPPGLAEFLLPGGGGGGAGAGDVYRNRPPARCLRSVSFWLLLFVNGACSGAGLTLLNNMAQLARALSLAVRFCGGLQALLGGRPVLVGGRQWPRFEANEATDVLCLCFPGLRRDSKPSSWCWRTVVSCVFRACATRLSRSKTTALRGAGGGARRGGGRAVRVHLRVQHRQLPRPPRLRARAPAKAWGAGRTLGPPAAAAPPHMALPGVLHLSISGQVAVAGTG